MVGYGLQEPLLTRRQPFPERHQTQVWIRNSMDEYAPRRKFWLIARKWRDKPLPSFFKQFISSNLKKPAMKLSMYLQMQQFAKNFAPDQEDVQAYWNTPPSLLLYSSKTTKDENKEDEKEDLVPIQSHDISFGNYIDACSYGNDLALFLEGQLGLFHAE